MYYRNTEMTPAQKKWYEEAQRIPSKPPNVSPVSSIEFVDDT